MKILVIAKSFIPPKGGGEISLLTLLERLRRDKKVEIYGICYGEKNEEKIINGYKLFYRNYKTASRYFPLLTAINVVRWFFKLIQDVKRIRPNLIITQVAYTPLGVTIALLFKIPVIVFLRGYEHFCLIDLIKGTDCDRKCYKCLKGFKKLLYPLYFIKLLWHRFSLKKANYVIANSKFMQQVCWKWYKIPTILIRSLVKTEDYKVKERKPEYITYILPRKEEIKGYFIFREITKRLPQYKFLLVGEKIEDLPSNVVYKGKISDMREVYSVTKILLQTSIYPEGFGRTCAEAIINGIPCVVSGYGALKEIVSDAGIVIKNIYNIDEWTNAIIKIMEDKDFYKYLVSNTKKQIKKFDFETNYYKFLKILDAFSKTS